MPARARLTTRLRQTAGTAVADGNRTIVQAARDLGLSWPVVHAAFTMHAAAVLPAEPQPVAVLGIDEVTASWTTTVDRWHVGFVDLIGGQGLLAQAEGRTSAAVTDWLSQRPKARREQVQAVTIDMRTVFKSAVREALPHAMLVVDHFHPVQLANRAVTEVRRRMTITHRGRRGRARDPEWQQRNRLTRSAARMRAEHVDRLTDTLSNLPAKIGQPILTAWNAKEGLLDLLTLARTRPDRETIARLLHRFYARCAATNPPRTAPARDHDRDLVARNPRVPAHRHHQRQLRRHQLRHQTIARNAYGFRNPENQRLRTRTATTRRHRGHLNPA